MVISDEIKFPRHIRVDPYKTERKTEAVDGVTPVARVGKFKREWQRRRGDEHGSRAKIALTAEAERTIKELVGQVNHDLENHDILIHLVLVKDAEGYSLDVYDCTDQKVCSIIKDLVIDLDDLPSLLRNLQQEVGILVDTVS